MTNNNDLVVNDKQAMNALKQHGGNIVTAILVVLFAFFGWQFYQKNYAKIDTTAADDYTTITERNEVLNLGLQKPDLDEASKANLAKEQKALYDEIDKLATTHSKTAYAWQALMVKAGHEVDANDYAKAIATLTQANHIGIEDKGLLAISRLQLAKVQLASGDKEAALATVNESYPESFEASRLEVLGDIELQRGNEEAAKTAYGSAWELLRKRAENRALLGLKMQSLGMTVEPITKPQIVAITPAG